MFANFFGGGEKKEAKPPAPPAKTKQQLQMDQQINIEATMDKLAQQIKHFQQEYDKNDLKMQKHKDKAKEFIAAGNQKLAQKYAKEAMKVKTLMDSIETRKDVLEQQRTKIDIGRLNKVTIESLEVANDHLKGLDVYTNRLDEVMLDSQNAKIEQRQMEERMKEFAHDSEEEEGMEEMMAGLNAEVFKEKQPMKKPVNVNVPAGMNTAKKQEQSLDDIMSMLN